MEFSKNFDSVRVGNLPSKFKKGKSYRAYTFVKDNKYTFANFYNMKGLSKDEIEQQKESLQIGLQNNGKYYIFAGSLPYEEEVNLND